ncbi:MAG: thiaminase II [Pseudomonadota bacterium]
MSDGQVSYGALHRLWRAGAQADWQAFTTHAFVEGLRDGSLPRPAFLHYLKQDYVFLIHFARAWALAVVKSNSLEEMRMAAGTVDALVNTEMSLHIATCAKEGLSEEALFATQEAPQNMAYTRYVMDAGLSGDYLDLMAALAPCVLGYGEIGARLLADHAPDTPYRDWIATYGGAEYQELCAQVGAVIDRAAEARLGDLATSPRLGALQTRFTQATTLEVGFWDMGLSGA